MKKAIFSCLIVLASFFHNILLKIILYKLYTHNLTLINASHHIFFVAPTKLISGFSIVVKCEDFFFFF